MFLKCFYFSFHVDILVGPLVFVVMVQIVINVSRTYILELFLEVLLF